MGRRWGGEGSGGEGVRVRVGEGEMDERLLVGKDVIVGDGCTQVKGEEERG